MRASIRLAARLDQVPRLLDFIAENLRRCTADGETLADIKLVAEESFSNIVRHGQPADDMIEVRLGCDGKRLYLVFADNGPAFDPLQAAGFTAQTDPAEGGMGLTLIKALTDRQEYQRIDGENRFTLFRQLPA